MPASPPGDRNASPTRRPDLRRRGSRARLPLALAGFAAVIALLPAGCAESKKSQPSLEGIVDPYSELQLMGPSRGFDPIHPPRGWLLVSEPSAESPRFTVAEKAGVLALKVTGEAADAALIRGVRTPLLAMPYLRWGWYLEPPPRQLARAVPATGPLPAGPAAPLRIIVGFAGGHAGAAGAPAQSGMPPFDRMLSLVWSAGPELRIEHIANDESNVSYVIREGASAASHWTLEAVDLSRIYREVWPQDNASAASVVFIGAGSGGVSETTTGYVAELVLSP